MGWLGVVLVTDRGAGVSLNSLAEWCPVWGQSGLKWPPHKQWPPHNWAELSHRNGFARLSQDALLRSGPAVVPARSRYGKLVPTCRMGINRVSCLGTKLPWSQLRPAGGISHFSTQHKKMIITSNPRTHLRPYHVWQQLTHPYYDYSDCARDKYVQTLPSTCSSGSAAPGNIITILTNSAAIMS